MEKRGRKKLANGWNVVYHNISIKKELKALLIYLHKEHGINISQLCQQAIYDYIYEHNLELYEKFLEK